MLFNGFTLLPRRSVVERTRAWFMIASDPILAILADGEQNDLGRKPAALEHRHRRDTPKASLLATQRVMQ